MKQTGFAKIVATLGPATSSQEKINQLVDNGVSVFRLNCSHGSMDGHKQNYDYIRKAEKTFNKHIGALFDLQGPKLRVGEFAQGEVMLFPGEMFRLDMNKALGDASRVELPHPEIFAAMEEGMDLLINDGKIKLRVEKFGEDYADTKVIVGGPISAHKGVNVPGVRLPISALTEKDIKDLHSAIEIGADWIALSFVQHPDDVKQALDLIKGRAGLICKIEKPSAIDHLDEIVSLTDAVMVARGDLGVESPIETVPVLQKRIVATCRQKGKPVIVATQMLESMMTSETPSRAEASDIATAVYDGADAVMLSGETAVGQFPAEAVAMMYKIIKSVEDDPRYLRKLNEDCSYCNMSVAAAITAAAANAVHSLKKVEALVTYTDSGSTTLSMASERPGVQILSITPNINVARKSALVWGVISVVSADLKAFEQINKIAIDKAKEKKLVERGDRIIITAGIPFQEKGTTNIMHIADINE